MYSNCTTIQEGNPIQIQPKLAVNDLNNHNMFYVTVCQEVGPKRIQKREAGLDKTYLRRSWLHTLCGVLKSLLGEFLLCVIYVCVFLLLFLHSVYLIIFVL